MLCVFQRSHSFTHEQDLLIEGFRRCIGRQVNGSTVLTIDTISAVHYRYIFNGRMDQQVISPDSVSNNITIKLTMTRKRYWG